MTVLVVLSEPIHILKSKPVRASGWCANKEQVAIRLSVPPTSTSFRVRSGLVTENGHLMDAPFDLVDHHMRFFADAGCYRYWSELISQVTSPIDDEAPPFYEAMKL